jgi:uncharacterized protein YebE (UPF0316 family)
MRGLFLFLSIAFAFLLVILVTDAATKSFKNSGTTKELHSVTYGNGSYVAVGNDGIILFSKDTNSWKKVNSKTTENLWAVTYGNGKFLAVGDNSVILTSQDATNWNIQKLSISGSGGQSSSEVVVGDIKVKSTTSNEGSSIVNFYSTCYGNGYFVVVGDSGTILSSSNGTNWNQGTLDYSNSGDVSVQVGDTKVSVKNSYSEGSFNLRGVTYGAGKFVAVGDDGAIFMSQNRINWKWVAYTCKVDNNLFSVTYGNGRYVAVGQNATILASKDAINWHVVREDSDVGIKSDLLGIKYGGNGVFAFVGADGLIAGSYDGTTWLPISFGGDDLIGITYANGNFVAVGRSVKIVIISL